jgi:hypothetical protein
MYCTVFNCQKKTFEYGCDDNEKVIAKINK